MFARICLPALLGAAFLASTSQLMAAAPRGASGEGKAWDPGLRYHSQSAGRRINHARDYVGGFRSYAAEAPKVVPMLGPEHVEEVSRNIVAAKKDLATVKKDANGDKDILTRVAAIEKHLDAATEQQKMMHDCCKEGADGTKTMECCESCMKHLDAAHKEHEALMKKIDPKAGNADKDHDHHQK
ncbi:hypothetical protein K2X85_16750 [bacterium]|nr:hypothetical protein [bacterium]